ncbi:hypothetical protein XENOCAPTIV_016507 [Xenoophorus captivus]|uniref:TNRC6 PABC binding domain-containing protein n=1 Tax=Xenoophorus captivus TaxID=1517983 RepID=A0ABV0SBE6_9TELE
MSTSVHAVHLFSTSLQRESIDRRGQTQPKQCWWEGRSKTGEEGRCGGVLPPHSGQGTQYDNPPWGHLPANRSATSAASSTSPSGWDQLIIDQKDSVAWPSITLSQSQASPVGCPLDTDPGHLTTSSSSSSSSCSAVSMATGANSQTGHFPANHLNSKANSGPSPVNHTGTSMLSSQVATNRSWGSGPGPSHCPAQSSVGNEGKCDSPVGGGGSRGWGSSSSSSTTNFNLNLNPNANPSAWPMLGHDGGGTGGGSSGGANTISSPQPTPNLCNPPGPPPAQTSACSGANNNSKSSGIGSAWGTIMTSDESHLTPSTNVSFSSEPQNLKTDGPNQTKKQEPPSPIQNLSGWGSSSVGLSPMGQPQPGGLQVNGEDDNSLWGNSGNSKPTSSKEGPGWDSAWGHVGGGAGNSGGWGKRSSGDKGKQHSEEVQGGWDAPSSPPQDSQANTWSRGVSTTGASEGSSDSMEGYPRRRDDPTREKTVPLLPAQDLDPRVLCNTGWGQTPVRQHTTWDMEDSKRKNEAGTESWGPGPATPSDVQGPSNTNTGPTQRSDPGNKTDVPGSQGPSGWGGSMAASHTPSSGWGDPPTNVKHPVGPSGWGNPPNGGPSNSIPKNGAQSWGEEIPSGWDDSQGKSTSQGWGEQPKTSNSWGSSGGSNNTGDWGEPEESKKSSSGPDWEGESGNWKENKRDWGMSTSGHGGSAAGSSGGWGDSAPQRPCGPPQGWMGKPQDGPNSNSGGGTIGSWGGPGSVKPGPGWSGGKKDPSNEPTGWEEPSPPSIRRKMEIDDGTSAWGDPGAYNKAVNLWDRNNPGMVQAKTTTGGSNPPGSSNNHPHAHNHSYHGPPAPLQNHSQNTQNPGPASGAVDPSVQHQSGTSHIRGPLIAQGKRDPAEEALKSNNMNLDQAMSALLEKKTELDKRGIGIGGHDYNNGLINKPMSCPRPPLLSKDPSTDPRLPFIDKVTPRLQSSLTCRPKSRSHLPTPTAPMLSVSANLGPPGKPPQIDDSYNPYNLISSSESPTSPLVPPESWGQGKNSSDKMANGTNINWPPEFCPGVPWKGLQNIDPETDPNVTPGSVPSGPTINTNIQDVNRYLLRDRSGGSSPTSSQSEALPPSSDWPVSAYASSFSLSSPEMDDAELKGVFPPLGASVSQPPGSVNQQLPSSSPSRQAVRDEINLVFRSHLSQPGVSVPRALEGPPGSAEQQHNSFPSPAWPHKYKVLLHLGRKLSGPGPRMEQLLHHR